MIGWDHLVESETDRKIVLARLPDDPSCAAPADDLSRKEITDREVVSTRVLQHYPSMNGHHQTACQQATSQLIHRAQASQKHAAHEGGPLHNKTRMTHRSASYQKLVRKTRHGECGTDAVIITLGSNYIIRTHKHRLSNKRELPFRCNHWRRATLTHC